MELPTDDRAMETVARRFDFLEHLEATPAQKHELVEELDASRSTVNRAITELESAGYVERVPDGYVATQSGRLAVDHFGEFVDEFETIVDAKPVLDGIPREYEPPTDVVRDARFESVEGPYELFGRIADLLRTVDRYRIVLPRVVDSRHVRILHSRVARGRLDVELLGSTDLFRQIGDEFPALTTDLAVADGFRAYALDEVPFALVIAESLPDDDAAPTAVEDPTVLLVSYDEDGPSDVLTTRHERAHAWATTLFEELRDAGDAASATLRSDPSTDAASSFVGTRLPPSLRTAGFRRVDDEFFEGRDPMSPAAALQSGLGLPEVAAGQAVDRTTDDGTPLSETLFDRVEGGAAVALVGPAGTGKSTVCKRVACEWHDSEAGPVLYRESGATPFESPDNLARAVRHAPGRTLVVVEDAVRSEAAAVFEAMRAVSGRDDVSFLFDARESEWHDADRLDDARLDAFRRDVVDVVTMPQLDQADCRRLLDHVESTVGEPLDVEPDGLEAAAGSSAVDGGAVPGGMVLSTHRLASRIAPGDGQGSDRPTTLDGDVDEVRDRLADRGDIAVDVGLLANVLNAAGVTLTDGPLHAVASERADGTGDDVAAALDCLDGHVLFDRADETGYRAIHETWSVRYLERSVEAGGERAARERFGRCVSAVLALADDPERCDRLARTVPGPTPGLDRIVGAPAEWVDEIATALFELGATYGTLAPVYGADGPVVDLPDVCPDETAVRCSALQGAGLVTAGRPDAAAAVYEHLESLADGLDEDLAAEARMRALLGRGDVAEARGDLETAADLYGRCLELSRAEGHRRYEAQSLLDLGHVGRTLGEFETSRDRLERAVELCRDLKDPIREARVSNELGYLAYDQGEYHAAREYHERALETYRSLGDRSGRMDCQGGLGAVALRLNEYDSARESFQRGYALARELGDTSGIDRFSGNLGIVAETTGDHEEAIRWFERSLAAGRSLGDQKGIAVTLTNYGSALKTTNDHERAIVHLEESLERHREVGNARGELTALVNLGDIASERGSFDEASEYLDRALEISRDIGNRFSEAGTSLRLGKIDLKRGHYEDARERFEHALEGYRDVGDDKGRTNAARNLGRIAKRQGAYDAAHRRLERALAAALEGDYVDETAFCREQLGDLARLRDDHSAAVDRLEAARDGFETKDNRAGLARVARRLGRIDLDRGDLADARRRFTDALETFDELGYAPDVALTRACLARLALHQDDLETARDQCEDALEVQTARDARHDAGRTRLLLGRIALTAGDSGRARDRFLDALDAFETVGAPQDELLALRGLAAVDSDRSDEWRRHARERLDEAPRTVATHHRPWIDGDATPSERA